MSNNELLKVIGVNVNYGSEPALVNVNLIIRQKEILLGL